MNTGLTRTSFFVKIFLVALACVLVAVFVYGGSFFRGSSAVEASVSKFYPTSCLGGWKNIDKIAGQPNVLPDNGAVYDDTNSASLFNSNSQIFCGGFKGEIPAAAKHQKVALHFSWYIDDATNQPVPTQKEGSRTYTKTMDDNQPVEKKTERAPAAPVVPASGDSDTLPSNISEPETPTPAENEPTAFNPFRNFLHVAHAQEVQGSEVTTESTQAVISAEEVVTTPSEPEHSPRVETAAQEASSTIFQTESETHATTVQGETVVVSETSPSEGAYFQVFYTLDGEEWHLLGFVSRIANDVEIEMPIDLFSSVEDLEKVQISLHTVNHFDSVPKIYLDSLWMEVTYNDVGTTDILPPGGKPGDVIFSETTYQDSRAVVVLRNVELATLSNLLSATAASTSSTTVDEQLATSSTTATTSPQNSNALTDFVSTSTLSSIINSTGVQVELWLYASTTASWSRIADDSIISRAPQVKFVAGSVFWVDKNDAGVWRFDPKSGGYDALSFSKGETSKMQFRDEAGELKELEFTFGTSSVLLEDVRTPVVTHL